MKRKLPAEAFDFYLGLGVGRSYSQVAEHYGVSKGAVTALAKRDGWQGRLAKVEAEARSKSTAKAVESLEQVNDRHLRIARSLQAKALEALRSMSLEDARDPTSLWVSRGEEARDDGRDEGGTVGWACDDGAALLPFEILVYRAWIPGEACRVAREVGLLAGLP